MTTQPIQTIDELTTTLQQQLMREDLTALAATVAPLPAAMLFDILEHMTSRQRAVIFRLLPKDSAVAVFDLLDPSLQSDLLEGMHDAEVARLFEELDPDDRAWLLEEVPAALATRLLRDLPEDERALTATLLGYKQGSVGRRMTPEYVSVREHATVDVAMQRVRERLDDAETVYTIPVLDNARRVVGVVSLRDLIRAEGAGAGAGAAGAGAAPAGDAGDAGTAGAAGTAGDAAGTACAAGDADAAAAGGPVEVASIMQKAHTAPASDSDESVARRCAELALLAMPIVDSEGRLVGMLTIDDAVRILEFEESEDAARQGGTEPLRRPYFSTPVRTLVRSRVVWLLVLAIGATLTVQVLSVFEATLEQVTVLALFVPLLIGTGGNTGNQAATTITRALALGDVRPKDIFRVLTRELRTGAMLGLLLGTLGFAIATIVYSMDIGLVIGLTLLAVCTVAAAVGGCMPLLARAVKVDPAVFSNPFISTFVDATGLIIYFMIARTILGL